MSTFLELPYSDMAAAAFAGARLGIHGERLRRKPEEKLRIVPSEQIVLNRQWGVCQRKQIRPQIEPGRRAGLVGGESVKQSMAVARSSPALR